MLEANIDNELVKIWSDELIVFLDYDEAEFRFILKPNSLQTSKAPLEANIARINDPIQFEGNYDLRRIPLNDHPQKEFEVLGEVQTDQSDRLFEGDAKMYYLNNGFFSSIITMELQMTLDHLGWKAYFPQAKNEVSVSIRHNIPQEQF